MRSRNMRSEGEMSMRLPSDPIYQAGDHVNGLQIDSFLGFHGKRRRKTYRCICRCGNVFEVDEYRISTKQTTCCPACNRKRSKENKLAMLRKEYIGKVIGHYRILEQTNRSVNDRSYQWKVQCLQCGRITIARTSRLNELESKRCMCDRKRS